MDSGTKQKTEAFYFFCKKLGFVLWGIIYGVMVFLLASNEA
jgi:tetrahydromethanopterin S-methyltransferase subunit E